MYTTTGGTRAHRQARPVARPWSAGRIGRTKRSAILFRIQNVAVWWTIWGWFPLAAAPLKRASVPRRTFSRSEQPEQGRAGISTFPVRSVPPPARASPDLPRQVREGAPLRCPLLRGKINIPTSQWYHRAWWRRRPHLGCCGSGYRTRRCGAIGQSTWSHSPKIQAIPAGAGRAGIVSVHIGKVGQVPKRVIAGLGGEVPLLQPARPSAEFGLKLARTWLSPR